MTTYIFFFYKLSVAIHAVLAKSLIKWKTRNPTPSEQF